MVIYYIILSNCYVENHFNIVNKFRRCKMKRTYQPKKRQNKKEHGFLKRMKTRAGQNVLKARRAKKRKKLCA